MSAERIGNPPYEQIRTLMDDAVKHLRRLRVRVMDEARHDKARIKALETALTLIAETGPDVTTAELAEFARNTLDQAE
jgi:hypothetical protein